MILILFGLILISANIAVIWLTLQFLPATVWPVLYYRKAQRAWVKHSPLLDARWRRLKYWPHKVARSWIERWMIWRVREYFLWFPDRTTCPACGKKAVHPFEFHPQARVLRVTCLRCKANFPKQPIYSAASWMPDLPVAKPNKEQE